MALLNEDRIARFRCRIPGLTSSSISHSQCGQDLFVLSMLCGKRHGTFLEIGAGCSEDMSNTALLEREFEWRGLGIEINPEHAADYRANRLSPVVITDATTADYSQLLAEAGLTDEVIDYASVDCEPPDNTFKALQQLPWDRLLFRVITFEHDTYNGGDRVRHASRKYLRERGYELVVSNMSDQGLDHNYEDWWVHPDLVDRSLIDKFKADGTDIKFWEDFWFTKV